LWPTVSADDRQNVDKRIDNLLSKLKMRQTPSVEQKNFAGFLLSGATFPLEFNGFSPKEMVQMAGLICGNDCLTSNKDTHTKRT
jgi:hypothetical protein